MTTKQNRLMRTINLYRSGDYLNAYGSDALILARELGLVRLTVHERHATLSIPAGTSQSAIPAHAYESAFKELRAKDWFVTIVDDIH